MSLSTPLPCGRLELSGDEVSPVKFLQLTRPRADRRQTEAILQGIVDQVRRSPALPRDLGQTEAVLQGIVDQVRCSPALPRNPGQTRARCGA